MGRVLSEEVDENVDGSKGRRIGEEGESGGEVDTGPSLTIPTSIMAWKTPSLTRSSR